MRFVALAGTTEFAKRWDPKPGDIVSFKHRGYMLTSNKPKSPTLYRIRNELTWDAVVHNWKEKIVTPSGMTSNNLPFLKWWFLPTAKPLITKKRHVLPSTGQWGSIAKRKEFLLEFAQKIGFDPLVIDNWRNKKSEVIDYGVYSTTTQHSLPLPPLHHPQHNITLCVSNQ